MVPPQAQAPTISAPQPAETKPVTPPSAQPPASSTSSETAKPNPQIPQKKKHVTRHVAKKPSTHVNESTGKPTVGQQPPNSSDAMQISADLPQGAAQSQRRETDQLLGSAEENLRKVTRQLSATEQGMMRQALNYIAQSRSAIKDGDFERAHNLAVKASLLASELVKSQ